jgi:hypothetical protein
VKEGSYMKHVVLFSGGAASSYVGYHIAKNHKDVVLLHTPTYAEHEDSDRFRKQVAEKIGLPITVQEDGRSLWELIDEYKAIPRDGLPFCTLQLKQRQTTKYLTKLKREGYKKSDICIYLGYDVSEWRRMQKTSARWESLGYSVKFPLWDLQMSSEDTKRIIRDEWGICLPQSYIHLKHNNCIPCFKGGMKHFHLVYKHYPEEFEKAAVREEMYGHTALKGISLRELQKQWDENVQIEFDTEETRPCMCAF